MSRKPSPIRLEQYLDRKAAHRERTAERRQARVRKAFAGSAR